MRPFLKNVSKELSTNLISEVKTIPRLSKNNHNNGNLWQLFIKEVAKEVAKQINQEEGQDLLKDFSIQAKGRTPREGLEKAEKKLEKFSQRTENSKEEKGEDEADIEKTDLEDLDEVDLKKIKELEKKGVRVIYPNLKYRKPKYQNVSEMLKYVESENEKSEAVKLVIMNFND